MKKQTKTTNAEKERWVVLLKEFIAGFRDKKPSDKRTDAMLCESFMEHLVSTGKAKKIDGKFVIPNIGDDA